MADTYAQKRHRSIGNCTYRIFYRCKLLYQWWYTGWHRKKRSQLCTVIFKKSFNVWRWYFAGVLNIQFRAWVMNFIRIGQYLFMLFVPIDMKIKITFLPAVFIGTRERKDLHQPEPQRSVSALTAQGCSLLCPLISCLMWLGCSLATFSVELLQTHEPLLRSTSTRLAPTVHSMSSSPEDRGVWWPLISFLTKQQRLARSSLSRSNRGGWRSVLDNAGWMELMVGRQQLLFQGRIDRVLTCSVPKKKTMSVCHWKRYLR